MTLSGETILCNCESLYKALQSVVCYSSHSPCYPLNTMVLGWSTRWVTGERTWWRTGRSTRWRDTRSWWRTLPPLCPTRSKSKPGTIRAGALSPKSSLAIQGRTVSSHQFIIIICNLRLFTLVLSTRWFNQEISHISAALMSVFQHIVLVVLILSLNAFSPAQERIVSYLVNQWSIEVSDKSLSSGCSIKSNKIHSALWFSKKLQLMLANKLHDSVFAWTSDFTHLLTPVQIHSQTFNKEN